MGAADERGLPSVLRNHRRHPSARKSHAAEERKLLRLPSNHRGQGGPKKSASEVQIRILKKRPLRFLRIPCLGAGSIGQVYVLLSRQQNKYGHLVCAHVCFGFFVVLELRQQATRAAL